MKLRNFVVVAVLFLCSCRSPNNSERPVPAEPAHGATERQVMHTYQVPAEHEKLLKRLLEANLYPITVSNNGVVQTQFSHLNPQFTGNGYFALSAPEGIHQGVRELIEVVTKAGPRPETGPVRVKYWLVLGWPAATMQIEPTIDPTIAERLSSLPGVGPMRFESLETLSLTSAPEQESQVGGSLTLLKQTASWDGNAIDLAIDLKTVGAKSSEARVITQLSLKPGEIAVLGQSGYMPIDVEGKPSSDPSLFYLVQAHASAGANGPK